MARLSAGLQHALGSLEQDLGSFLPEGAEGDLQSLVSTPSPDEERAHAHQGLRRDLRNHRSLPQEDDR